MPTVDSYRVLITKIESIEKFRYRGYYTYMTKIKDAAEIIEELL
jgi:hypothetical protein